jgi:O-antigen ligase
VAPSFGALLRIPILALLVLAPLAFASIPAPAYAPLLVTAGVVGVLSWGRGHLARAHGASVPPISGTRLLLALHALVLLQLLPLPPSLLRFVSPGSFAFYDDPSLLPLTEWRPVTVSPADTLRGLLFLGGMSLLYAAVFREFDDGRWRRRAAATVVATGLLITIEAFMQAATGDTKIYGLWRPRWDWAVFGPYVNRNHFAGYLAMAIPLALAFAAEAFQSLRIEWRRRRHGWLALGDRAGSLTVGLTAVAMGLIAGLLAAQSRGGALAFLVSALALPLAFRQRWHAGLVVGIAAILGVSWIGMDGILHGFETRGIRGSRLEMWADVLRMVPRFPLLGAGFNAFGTAYPSYQTASRGMWWGQAHNEYLQSLVDLGVAGAALTAALLVRLFRVAIQAAPRGALAAGLLGSLLASAATNLVDFNWQIPANAATFAVLAGLALRGALDPRPEAT